MVPTHKLHPSSVEVLVVSVVNGASVDADLPPAFVSDLWVGDVRPIWMLNYVIMCYTLIFALIYWLPLTTSPHVCIVAYMWVHPVCYLNQV
jgi:hypothetical protein